MVLSALNQKIYLYPQKIPLGTLPVTFIVFPNSFFLIVEELEIKLKGTFTWFWFVEVHQSDQIPLVYVHMDINTTLN